MRAAAAAAAAVAAAAALACCSAAAAPASRHAARSLEPYAGLGAWVSIFDTKAWDDPAAVVRKLHTEGVRTLYLETSNYREPYAIRYPAAMGQFVDAAHAEGIGVVAWYLPSLANEARDLRRVRAALAFRSPGGGRFDSFALDIESTAIRSIPKRNAHAVALAAAVRRLVPRVQPLGAITIAPVGASPSYWPDYPFRRLAASVQAFLPMTYFTDRVHGAAKVAAYTAANVSSIRDQAGNPSFPVHPIGGDALAATPAELAAFLRAATSSGAVGDSLWEYGETTPAQWAVLARSAGR